MSKYQNLEEGLTDLMNRMKEDNPTWPEELTVMYFSRVTALENLMFMCKDNQLNHNAWANFLQHLNAEPREFGIAEWMMTYQHISSLFNVPMSWVNALSLRVVTDPMKLGWTVSDLCLVDDEGYLQESSYAAWVDGISEGLLPEADKEQEEYMAGMRHPTMTRISKHVGEQFESLVDFYDMDVDDAKKMLGFVYDCTLA